MDVYLLKIFNKNVFHLLSLQYSVILRPESFWGSYEKIFHKKKISNRYVPFHYVPANVDMFLVSYTVSLTTQVRISQHPLQPESRHVT